MVSRIAPLSLQSHTIYSDGNLSPESQIRFLHRVYNKKTKGKTPGPLIAFTDHDHTGAANHVKSLASELNMTVLQGGEYSIRVYDKDGALHKMHATVLFPQDDKKQSKILEAELKEMVKRVEKSRIALARETLEKLEDKGWSTQYVDRDDVLDGRTITKAKIARALFYDGNNSAMLGRLKIKSALQLRELIVLPNSELTRHLITCDELARIAHKHQGYVVIAHPYLPNKPNPMPALDVLTAKNNGEKIDFGETLYPHLLGKLLGTSRELTKYFYDRGVVPVVSSDIHNTETEYQETKKLHALYDNQQPITDRILKMADGNNEAAKFLKPGLLGYKNNNRRGNRR
ncbi:MAG: hypothetical protein WC408_03765 [Candidatus Micrarchaeia archaeon]|jgi:predicted metal-dependent phosphoesterase TrpH